MELLMQRDRSSRNSQLYASLSADMRFKTKQYTIQIEQLKNQVETDIKRGTVYPFRNFLSLIFPTNDQVNNQINS